MAYRAYRSDRRFRRRRWLMIVVSLVAIVGMIAYLVSRETEQRGAVEFFAAADESSDLHRRAAAELESALASIGAIKRQDLARRLQNVADTSAEADSLLDVEVPSSIGTSYGTMATASSSWKDGAAGLNTTIMAIMDGDLVKGATKQLREALDLLRVGDGAFSLFLGTLEIVPEDVEVPAFIPVVYINPEAQDLLYDAQTLVLRIQTSYDLSPRRDVGVTAMTDPQAVGESVGLPVVPFAPALDVQAVITNFGNLDESTVDVKLEIFNVDTGTTFTVSERVTDLAAGMSTTVTFVDVGVAPGGLYQVKVTVTIIDDIDPDNNVWDMTFIWRGES